MDPGMVASFETVSNELRVALDEFFAPHTSNERKRDIGEFVAVLR